MTSVGATALNDPCSDNDSNIDQDEMNSSSDEAIQSSHSMNTNNSIRPNSMWFRAQKRLVGHVINPQSIKSIAGPNTYNLLRELRTLMKLHMESKEQAKKVYDAILKTIGKFAVVAHERKLTHEDYSHKNEVKRQCRIIALTCASFAQTEYTYDRLYLTNLLRECEQTLIPAVQPYLSQRSISRIEFLFNSLLAPEFLDSVFSPQATKEQKRSLNQLVRNFNLVLSEHSI